MNSAIHQIVQVASVKTTYPAAVARAPQESRNPQGQKIVVETTSGPLALEIGLVDSAGGTVTLNMGDPVVFAELARAIGHAHLMFHSHFHPPRPRGAAMPGPRTPPKEPKLSATAKAAAMMARKKTPQPAEAAKP